MYKVNNAAMAKERAKEDNLSYGMSVFDGKWYVGTPEELKKVGVTDIDKSENMSKAKHIIDMLEEEKRDQVYARYLYQPVGMGSPSTWHFLKSIPASNTPEGHDRLVKEWNWRDKGKKTWRWEEVEKEDIDYPKG